MEPLRLNAVAAIGPGAESNALKKERKSISYVVGMTADKRTLQACASVFVPEVDGTIGA